MIKKAIIIAGVLGTIGVIAGALGAHALKNTISSDQLHSFETGVKYQMYHALVLLFIGLYLKNIYSKTIKLAFTFFIIGTILFSGSIYILALKDIIGIGSLKFIGPVTPLGGLFLIMGWGLIIWEGISLKN